MSVVNNDCIKKLKQDLKPTTELVLTHIYPNVAGLSLYIWSSISHPLSNRSDLPLQQAKTVAGEMGSLMLKLGLVELSTKTISTVLKSNAVTFVAGGVVQGVSAAYLTRIAGLALIEYFEQQEIAANSGSEFNLEKFGQSLQQVFAQNQQVVFLQSFVKQGVKRLLPEAEKEVVAIENAAV